MIQNTSVVFLPQVVAFVLHLLHLCTCCIYETFVVLKRQGKYSHSRPLSSHLCNICCIFATPVHYVRLSPYLVPFLKSATPVVYIPQVHTGRLNPCSRV